MEGGKSNAKKQARNLLGRIRLKIVRVSEGSYSSGMPSVPLFGVPSPSRSRAGDFSIVVRTFCKVPNIADPMRFALCGSKPHEGPSLLPLKDIS